MKDPDLALRFNCDRAAEEDGNPASIIIILILLTFYFPTYPLGDIGWSTNSVILLVTLTAIVSSAAAFTYLKPLAVNSKNTTCQPIQEKGGDPFGYSINRPIECSDKAPVTGTPKLCGGDCILYVPGRPSKQ
uniref:Uncharacterized protein n=1 Tax=Amphimedon queenslandica TaxID=400682 RepID=A0A1X7VLY9_AMPQE